MIYTGYAENGIESVVTFKDTTLQSAVFKVEQIQLDEMLEDDEELDEDYYNEFFGHGRVEKGVGLINSGEENLTLVLDETSEWYDKVDTFSTWDDELFEKWNDFLNDF